MSQRELFGLQHPASGDPIDFFTKGMDLKIRLQGLGEDASKEVHLDIMLSSVTKSPEFTSIREMHCREEFTSVDRPQETANCFYVDQQSRNASGPVPRPGLPRWCRPPPTSAIDARRTCISSMTASNKCKITVLSRVKISGITSAAVVGVVLSRNGALTATPPRTAMLSVRNSRSCARTRRRSPIH